MAPASRPPAGSVPYTEEDFLTTISSLSDPVSWQHVSDKAYAQAQQLTWDNTLRPLDSMLRALPPRNATAHI
jgi:hypothetical protein